MADKCATCGEKLEECCDGFRRCLNCRPCPCCSDGPGPLDRSRDEEPEECPFADTPDGCGDLDCPDCYVYLELDVPVDKS